MLNNFTKKYIIKKAKEKNIRIPKNYLDKLNSYRKMVEKFGHKLEFRQGRNLPPNQLNANSGLFKWSSIVVTPEWAAVVALYNGEQSKNAFLITLGHELTHKDKQMFALRYGLKYKKFISWVNEVHADFGAAQKMTESSREALLKSIDYKKALRKDDQDYKTHPSWKRRRYYAENFDFNKALIKQIAKDTKCQNEKLIEKISKFYDEIILK